MGIWEAKVNTKVNIFSLKLLFFTYLQNYKRMKKNLLILFTTIAIASCSMNHNSFVIKGELTGELENGIKVYLKGINKQNQPINIDTTTIENGVFNFKGVAKIPKLHFIFIDKIQGSIPLILENGKIELKAQKDSLNFAEVKGTLQNDFLYAYLEDYRELSLKAMSINDDMIKANANKEEATISALRVEYIELQEEAKNYDIKYIKEHPEALISALTLFKLINSKALSEEEASKMYDLFTQEIKDTSQGKKLKEHLEKSKNISIGAKAPDFSAPTPTGEQLSLKDVLGKVTILEFWASWCRPCRAENPNLIDVYNEYHDKGLNIMAVSLDKNVEDWKKAIKDDGLIWSHVSNVNYFGEIAKLYNLNAIPSSFILDENGIIIAKNIRGPALGVKMAELLP